MQKTKFIQIPECFPFERRHRMRFDQDTRMREFEEKEKWQKIGMYAHVNWQWVRPLADWIGGRKVLEVMSGAGWLTKALREIGTSIIATDDFSWIEKRGWQLQTEVERLEASEAVSKYGADADLLLISWPYMDSDAYHAIVKWDEVNASGFIIYIGELGGGCTADDDFHDHFEVIEDESFCLVQNSYRFWDGLHDRPYIGKFSKQTLADRTPPII